MEELLPAPEALRDNYEGSGNEHDNEGADTCFKSTAANVGDVVTPRVRKQKTVEGVTHLHYSNAAQTLLPPYFTWGQLYREVHNYVAENRLDVREPKQSTCRQYLTNFAPRSASALHGPMSAAFAESTGLV
ncbi:hypothetical protein PC128_g22428 [Phytophthora cactorum]|nr:hypothetical protein PC120_g19386 [Phytophthora cactorum]KAG3154182.1 hypothetical protein PC128_g22428 [Phytophthora cactorum]